MRDRLRRWRWVARGLRFRLTLTYIIFFALLLSFLGVFFRETLFALYEQQLHHILSEEWTAVRAYLRIEKPKKGQKWPEIVWYYDRDDPEEALIVDRLRQVYLLADSDGTPLQVGPKYDELPTESSEEIRAAILNRNLTWKTTRAPDGTSFLIRSGVINSEDDKPYYLAIGRTYEEGQRIVDQFTWYYFWLLPVMLGGASILGWFMAGRALVPVNRIADTAQRITSANLTERIRTPGTRDELDRLVEAFNRMMERLEQGFNQTRQFSTDVSHELRTPLTAIRGQLEVALLAATTPAQYREAILTALEDVERLSQTIRALLLLSHAESGQTALQLQRLDLAPLIEHLVDEFQIPAEGAGLRLTASLPAACVVDADKIQMERLISNLLSNAIKYTQAGGEVHVTLMPGNPEVTIVIEDTGVGIAEDHLPHIFDRFYRVPTQQPQTASSPERGLGLGLSFVAWIVKAHRGRIDVESAPGKGTRFTILLPANTGVRVPEPAAQVASRST